MNTGKNIMLQSWEDMEKALDFFSIEYIMEYKQSSIYMLREDCIPYSYGGNKVRIGVELLRDMLSRGANALISYGSSGSNLNRVMADLCADFHIPCTVVISREKHELKICRNEMLCQKAGARIIHCAKDEVRQTIEEQLLKYQNEGYKPYYIYGNILGTGNEEVLQSAYRKLYDKIQDYMQKHTSFDYLVLVRGTGMTMDGLISGRDPVRSEKTPWIHGISIARKMNLRNEEKKSSITDQYICGGYGQYNAAIIETIDAMEHEHGIFLDPTYTGKAFWGMLSDIDAGHLFGKILFIHTGGYPIYEEFRKKK